MGLTTVSDYQNALNAVLWAQDINRGGFFFNEINRDGGLPIADTVAIRDAYLVYKKTRVQQQSISPPDAGHAAHEDTGTTIHGTNSPGDQRPGPTR